MKLLILGTPDARREDIRAYYNEYRDFFQGALEGEGITPDAAQLFTTTLDDLLITITTEQMTVHDTYNNLPFEAYDAVFTRGHGFMEWQDVMAILTDFASRNSVKMVNEYHAKRRISKLLQTAQFQTHGLTIPVTVSLNPAALAHHSELAIQTPFIMKEIDGSLGKGNYIIKDWAEVEAIMQRRPDIRYILQEFVPNDGDYRLFFMGNELLPIYRQAIEGSHLNNTSQGGQATLHSPDAIPAEVIEGSHAIMDYYGMPMVGIDVMPGRDGKYYFLEVNAQPQLITGALLAEKQVLLGKFLRSLQ